MTKLKRSRKNQMRPLFDKVLWRRRALNEGVNEPWNNRSHIEHTPLTAAR